MERNQQGRFCTTITGRSYEILENKIQNYKINTSKSGIDHFYEEIQSTFLTSAYKVWSIRQLEDKRKMPSQKIKKNGLIKLA